MKGITLILALLIFSTSLKASAFISGMANALHGEMTTVSCCKSVDSSLDQECDLPQEEEESDCCEGNSCDCACCLHIAYISHLGQMAGLGDDFAEVKFGYSFLYQADYLTAVFHPPSNS